MSFMGGLARKVDKGAWVSPRTVCVLTVRGIERDLPAYIFPYHEHFLVVVAEAASLGGFQTFSRELESWLEMGCRYAQGFLCAKPQPADYSLDV